MPTTNDNRSIKITANSAGVTASDFQVDFAASFSSDSALTLNFTDKSADACDRTHHEVVISDPATGSEIGRSWIKVKVLTKELGDFSATLDRIGRSTIDPPAAGEANKIRDPSTSDLRRWAQPVAQSGGSNVLRNVAVVEAMSSSAAGSVSQTLRTNDASELLIAVDFSDARGGTVASGTLTLTTTATAGAGYEVGKVVITDTEDDGDSTRRVIR
jgi:hypothetical protein